MVPFFLFIYILEIWLIKIVISSSVVNATNKKWLLSFIIELP